MGNRSTMGYTQIAAKDIKVGISIQLTQANGEAFFIDYSTDLDRFRITLEYVRTHPAGIAAVRETMYRTLTELVDSNAPVDEYMFTIGMHYLVSFDICNELLKKVGNDSVGLVIFTNRNDIQDVNIIGLPFESWLKARQYINAA
jgi:hypothetical protein